mmetsp:Transcript_46337/g.99224  ORF Transcript_46337/g.99224 Transcript_46337/m.99224 type:complete len:252 (+) Transcript_46337:1696-2451(+)
MILLTILTAIAMSTAAVTSMSMTVAIIATLVAVAVPMPSMTSMAPMAAMPLCLKRNGFEVERTEVCELSAVDHTLDRADNRGRGVVGSDSAVDLSHLLLVHEIQFVEQDLVREGDLLVSLLVILATLAFRQPIHDGLRVHQCDGSIDLKVLRNVWSLAQGPHDWNGVRHPCRLDEHRIQGTPLLHLLPDGIEGPQQVAANGAAHAAILHHHDLLGHAQSGVLKELVVDGNCSELVLDHSELFVLLMAEKVV